MSEVNRNSVVLDLFDVFGDAIRDDVEVTFFSQRARSLNQRFRIRLDGALAKLADVPAFPWRLEYFELV